MMMWSLRHACFCELRSPVDVLVPSSHGRVLASALAPPFPPVPLCRFPLVAFPRAPVLWGVRSFSVHFLSSAASVALNRASPLRLLPPLLLAQHLSRHLACLPAPLVLSFLGGIVVVAAMLCTDTPRLLLRYS